MSGASGHVTKSVAFPEMFAHRPSKDKCQAGPWGTASLLLAHSLLIASLLPLRTTNAAGEISGAFSGSASFTPRKVRVGMMGSPYKRQSYGLNFSEGMKVASSNSGNQIWAYGTERLFDPSAVEWVSGDEVRQAPHSMSGASNPHGRVDAFLLGTANLFFNESLYTRVSTITRLYMEMIRIYGGAPTLMVGLGTQADFSSGLQLGAVVDPRWHETELQPSTFRIHPEQKQLYMQVKNTTGDITVRGTFTHDAIVANGMPPPLVLNCPSYFINHDPGLGALMEAKRNTILAKRDYANLRLAIGFPHIPEYWQKEARPLLQFIADLFKAFPRSFVVVQTPEDFVTIGWLNEYGVSLGPDRVKYFYDPEHWIEGVREQADFAFSFRIHGAMACTAAGVPSVVIATDHRITELASGMRLANTRLQDPGFDARPFDLFNFISTVPFDGKAFDQRRVEIAKQYAQLFGRLNLPVNPGIARIAAGNVLSIGDGDSLLDLHTYGIGH